MQNIYKVFCAKRIQVVKYKSLVQTGYEFTVTTNKNLFMKIV